MQINNVDRRQCLTKLFSDRSSKWTNFHWRIHWRKYDKLIMRSSSPSLTALTTDSGTWRQHYVSVGSTRPPGMTWERRSHPTAYPSTSYGETSRTGTRVVRMPPYGIGWVRRKKRKSINGEKISNTSGKTRLLKEMPCTRTACRTAAVFTSLPSPSVNCPPVLTWTPSPSSTPATLPGPAPWRRGRGSVDTSSTLSGGPRTSPGSASISPTPGTSTDLACSELVALIVNYLFDC